MMATIRTAHLAALVITLSTFLASTVSAQGPGSTVESRPHSADRAPRHGHWMAGDMHSLVRAAWRQKAMEVAPPPHVDHGMSGVLYPTAHHPERLSDVCGYIRSIFADVRARPEDTAGIDNAIGALRRPQSMFEKAVSHAGAHSARQESPIVRGAHDTRTTHRLGQALLEVGIALLDRDRDALGEGAAGSDERSIPRAEHLVPRRGEPALEKALQMLRDQGETALGKEELEPLLKALETDATDLPVPGSYQVVIDGNGSGVKAVQVRDLASYGLALRVDDSGERPRVYLRRDRHSAQASGLLSHDEEELLAGNGRLPVAVGSPTQE